MLSVLLTALIGIVVSPTGQAADPAQGSAPPPAESATASPSPGPTAGPLPVPTLDWQQTIQFEQARAYVPEVTTWSGGFAALGRGDSGLATIWVSRDGSSWTSQMLPFLEGLQSHLGALDGRLVIVAAVPSGDSDRLASWVSHDGRHWRRAKDRPVMAMPGMHSPFFLSISRPLEVDGQLVVYGDWDGSRGAVPFDFAFVSAPARKNAIVAWRTRDGLHWTRRPITGSLLALDCVAEDGERLVGLDYGSPLVASADGVRWAPLGELPMEEDDDCVWPTASGYLQVGETEAPSGSGGAIGTSVSLDGHTWSAVQLIPDLKNVDVGVLGDTVLLDGERWVPDPADFVDLGDLVPAQFLSIDGGRTWSPTSGWPSAEIASDGQVVVAVGDGAWVAPLE